MLESRLPWMFISVVTLLRAFLTALSFVLAVMAVFAWRRRRLAPEAPIFALLILSAAIYCFGYAGEVAQSTLAGAKFWLHVEYFGVPWIPAFWLLGALKHNGLRSHRGLLFTIPLLNFVSQLTNSLHGFHDRSVDLVHRGPFWVVEVQRGPIAWLSLAYLVGALVFGAGLYIVKPSASGNNAMQRWIMVGSSLIPLGGYLVYLFGYSPWGLDLAPSMLGASVVLAYIAVFRFGCFDLVPMARSLVFNNMRDAVLVADLQQRLVDFNPAASDLLPCLAKARVGDDLASVLKNSPDLARVILGPDGTYRTDIETGQEKLHFDVRVFPLFREALRSGSAAILADITAQVRLVHELRHKAETDALTGVANRRCFVAAIEREIVRSARNKEPFSVALVDLDRFKAINDRMGHQAGDSTLVSVVGRVVECMRGSDLLSRFGGDEFAILLPQTGVEGALEVAERIRAAVADRPVEVEGENIDVSISIGIATHAGAERASWNQLLKDADKALYRAKAQGRNKVMAWKSAPAASSHKQASAARH